MYRLLPLAVRCIHRSVEVGISLTGNFYLPRCSSQDLSGVLGGKRGGFENIFFPFSVVGSHASKTCLKLLALLLLPVEYIRYGPLQPV